MSNSTKSINTISIITIASEAILQITNFILIPILTRALGASGYGTISLYNTWLAIIIAVCGLQTTQAVIYIILDKDEAEQGEYLASMLTTSVVSFTIVFVASICVVCFGHIQAFSPLLLSVLFVHAFGNYCVNYMGTILKQKQQPGKLIILSLFVGISTLLLSILFVHQIKDENSKYYGRIFGYAIPYTLVGIFIYCILVIPEIKNLKIKYVKEYLPLCLPIILHSLAANIFSQSNRIMLNSFNGREAVGIYSFTYSVAALLSVVWVTLNSFYQPFFFSYMKSQDFASIKRTTTNMILLFTSLYAMFVLVVPEMLKVFGGKGFSSAIIYMPVMAYGIYFNFLYLFNSNFEIFYKESGVIAKGTIYSAVINIVLNLILIPKFSVNGASIATLISFIALFIFHNFNAKRIAKKNNAKFVFFDYEFISWAIIAFLITLISYYLKESMIIRFSLMVIVFALLLIKMIRQKSII
jgi:O-antigen/teichoic acid export membrane protein